MLPTGHTSSSASPSATSQDTCSPRCEPATIDHTLCQGTFSTFGVSGSPTTPDDYENIHADHFIQHKGVEKSDSQYKDGLEDSHSSFSTFSVPANRFL